MQQIARHNNEKEMYRSHSQRSAQRFVKSFRPSRLNDEAAHYASDARQRTDAGPRSTSHNKLEQSSKVQLTDRAAS